MNTGNLIPYYCDLRDVDGLSHEAAIAKLICMGFTAEDIRREFAAV